MDSDNTFPKAARKQIAKSDLTSPPPLKKRRLDSGAVAAGTHTSGYDEILPTNTQNHLLGVGAGKSATVSAGTEAALGGAHVGYKRKRAKEVFTGSEGSRMDTASALLALPAGDVAFHTHAGGSTTGQAAGHDVRRRAFARSLSQDWSVKADAVFGGAVMLASRPPAEIARAGVDTTQLRDQSALAPWEKNRQTAKGIVNAGFNALPKTEQTAVRKTLQFTFDELNAGAPKSKQRSMAAGAPTSPRRATAGGAAGTASGGGYMKPFTLEPPAAAPAKETAAAFSRRASKPFRKPRGY